MIAPNAKSRKERRIPISTTRFRSALEQRAFLGPQAFVFGNAVGEPQADFRDAWEKVLARAEITDRRRVSTETCTGMTSVTKAGRVWLNEACRFTRSNTSWDMHRWRPHSVT